jgi:hypothetical protein
LCIRSSAGYTIDTHESRFRKRQEVTADDHCPLVSADFGLENMRIPRRLEFADGLGLRLGQRLIFERPRNDAITLLVFVRSCTIPACC